MGGSTLGNPLPLVGRERGPIESVYGTEGSAVPIVSEALPNAARQP
jgi:hypothetical protein